MELQFLIVFRQHESTNRDNDEEGAPEVMLYYGFDGVQVSADNKLALVGVISGAWSLTDSLGGNSGPQNTSDDADEQIVELADGAIVGVRPAPSKYIICVGVRGSTEPLETHLLTSLLWKSCAYLQMLYGEMETLEKLGSLTHALNDFFPGFWRDTFDARALERRGIAPLWRDITERAELSPNDQAWQKKLMQQVLLRDESFLGIRDLLIYHLPQANVSRRKCYGLVENFHPHFDDLSTLTNWIFHLNDVYGPLSSHVLAGTIHYRDFSIDSEQPNDNTSFNADNEVADDSFVVPTRSVAEQFWSNLKMPASLVYDAVQEVGATTGISMFKDYLPRFRKKSENRYQNTRSGYLISPLASSQLPETYKVRLLNLKFDGVTAAYQTLFWYYQDVLVVIIADQKFDKIFQRDYLVDLGFELRTGIELLYETALASPSKTEPESESFGYFVIKKKPENHNELLTSLPFVMNDEKSKDISAFRVAINGVDHFISAWNPIIERESQDSYMGDGNVLKNGSIDLSRGERSGFLGELNSDQLWDIQKTMYDIVFGKRQSLKNSGIHEERLLRLGNGLFCYLREDDNELALIIRNWYNKDEIDVRYGLNKDLSMISSLGNQVVDWWMSKE